MRYGTPPKLPFYVVADTHFFHKKIVEYCDRPFDHEQMMLKRWERTVKRSDTVLHLGDLFFGGAEGYERFRHEISPRLSGKKYIILGNHDKKRYDYDALGFIVVKPFSVLYRGYEVSFAHYPTFVAEDKALHVHGHIHNHCYSRGEPSRTSNINVSMEVVDYRPHRASRLIDKEIRQLNQKQRYYNSRGFRWAKAKRVRV